MTISRPTLADKPILATQGARTVEVIQYTGENRHIIAKWSNTDIREPYPGVLEIKTPHGVAMLHVGGWLVFSNRAYLPVTAATFDICYNLIGVN